MTAEQLAALRTRMQHHVAKLEKFGAEGFHTPVTANEVLELLDRIEHLEAAPVPQGYDSGVQTGNRVTLAFDTQSNATAWFEKFCDDYDAAAGTKTIKLPIPANAASQPPEAEPAQLPEPEAVTSSCGDIAWRVADGSFVCDGRNPFVKLYTEQQVRELLAAHGIEG